LYTIQNLRGGSFLNFGPGSERDGAFVIGKPSDGSSNWAIQSVNRGETFLIGRPGKAQLALGFSDYIAEDLNFVRLKPAEIIPSQMWFFETSQPIAEDSPFATRLLKADGEFVIKNCYNESYITVEKTKRHEDVDTGKRDGAARFKLEYLDAYSPVFTLRQAVFGGKGNWLADVENSLGMLGANSRDETKQWIAIPISSDDKSAYYICSNSRGFPLMAASVRKVDDGGLPLDEKVKGDVMQYWQFEE